MYNPSVIRLPALRQPGDEKQRQVYTKQRYPVSRFMDNHFEPKLHESAWWPNGLYILKKKYTVCDSGLTYNFEKDNVLHKLDIDQKEKNKKTTKDFLEYNDIQQNEFMMTIEYCANCEDHQTHTQHNPETYKNYALAVQKCIMMRYPFIKVILKPISTEIHLESTKVNALFLKKTKIVDEKFQEVRLGAMEIQLCFKDPKNGKNVLILLHSKLKTGTWPNTNNILNQIVQYVPLFDCDLTIYDAEQVDTKTESDDPNLNDDDKKLKKILQSKIVDIEVNIYKFHNSKIDEYTEKMKEEIEHELDPHKRKIVILSKRKEMKESYRSSSSISMNMSSTNNNTINSNSMRPGSSNSMFGMTNGNSMRPISTLSNNINLTHLKEETKILRDRDLIETFKGEKLRTYYTDTRGKISFKEMPYDTYLIEVVESKNFQKTAIILTFNHISHEKNIKKFIGLRKQQNAFLELYLYYTVNKEEMQLDPISEAEVYLKFLEESMDETNFNLDEIETKVKVKEHPKIKGRYDYVLVPGKYLLEVKRKGYEEMKQAITLNGGENKVNVEVYIEKKYDLKINVLSYESNYEKISPIENAHIKVNN